MKPSPILHLPAPSATARLSMPDGAVIALRRYGDPDGPRVAMSHGNGLAIDAYFPFWRAFLTQYDLILFDVRNHGRNPLHDQPDAHSWASIRLDFDAIFDGIAAHFGTRACAGIFHSLSAVAAVEQTLQSGPRWSPLILIDPPLFPPAGHPLEDPDRLHMRDLARVARFRPQTYATLDDFVGLLQHRRSFSRWVPGAHALFAASTLRPGPDGRWQLACPRELEARIFETNVDPTAWQGLAQMPVPTMIIGADPDLPDAQMPPRLAAAAAAASGVHYRCLRGTTHFLQVEQPRRAAALAHLFLARQRRRIASM